MFGGPDFILSIQIKDNLDSLLAKQKDLADKWDRHQERLQYSEYLIG